MDLAQIFIRSKLVLCKRTLPWDVSYKCVWFQGEEFDSAVQQTAEALCELKSAHAVAGLMAWCEQVSGQKYSWMNGTVMKAKGW